MKTRKQKVICILVSVFLLASFFCIPVSAADDYYTVTFEYPFFDMQYDDDILFEESQYYFGFVHYEESLNDNNWMSGFRRPLSTWFAVDENGKKTGFGFDWDWPSGYANQGYVSFMLGRSKFGVTSYATSDTVWVDPVKLNVILDYAYTGVFNCRFALRSVTSSGTGSVVGYSDWVHSPVSTAISGYAHELSIPQMSIKLTKGGQFDGLAVFIEFDCSSMNSRMGLGMAESGITFNYGKGSSPNYPSYTAPSGGDEIGSLGEGEQELIDSSQEGMDSASDSFNSVSSDFSLFGTGLLVVGQMLGGLTDTLPGISSIVRISLSLGLFATLLSLTASIIGAGARRSGGSKGSRGKK